jgi:tetratricopeptide (TPR) repeat protein
MGRTDAAEQVFQRAIATYRRVVKECPQASAYWYSLALTCLHFDAVLLKANRFQESEQLMKEVIAMLDKVVRESPAVAEYRHELANTYTRLASLQERKGDVTEAEKSYRQVLDQYQQLIHDNPELADYREKMGRGHLRLARLLAISKRHAEAEISYREAIRLTPKDDRPHTNLAWLLIDDGNTSRNNPAEAVTLAEKAVQLNPKSKDNWGILGAALYRAGSWSKSRHALEEAVRLDNGGTAFEGFFLAMAYARLGDAMQARSWFDRSVSWAEEHPARKIELQRLRAETEEVLGSLAPP